VFVLLSAWNLPHCGVVISSDRHAKETLPDLLAVMREEMQTFRQCGGEQFASGESVAPPMFHHIVYLVNKILPYSMFIACISQSCLR
jgi:hypothetical protein